MIDITQEYALAEHKGSRCSCIHILVIRQTAGSMIVSVLFQMCFIKGDGTMIQRSIKNTMTRVIIARRLSVATEMVAKGRRDWMVKMHLEEALSQARTLPDNPGNRAIRASIVAALEALNHDA